MKVNEIFYSIQGEGFWTGTPCVFVRLSGCDRKCDFCDTNFEFFREMSVDEVISKIKSFECDHVVITGGEPMLQHDLVDDLVRTLKKNKFRDYFVHLETNGDFIADDIPFDWITVSPKVPGDSPSWKMRRGDELKVVYEDQPDKDINEYYNNSSFDYYYIQPATIDHNTKATYENTQGAYRFVLAYPGIWNLSIQIHKLIGVN